MGAIKNGKLKSPYQSPSGSRSPSRHHSSTVTPLGLTPHVPRKLGTISPNRLQSNKHFNLGDNFVDENSCFKDDGLSFISDEGVESHLVSPYNHLRTERNLNPEKGHYPSSTSFDSNVNEFL